MAIEKIATIHYDSAPMPQRSCFVHPNITYTVTLIHVLHSNSSFGNKGTCGLLTKGFDSLYLMIRKGVLLLLTAIHLTSGKFLLISLGSKHQINNFNGKNKLFPITRGTNFKV